MNICSIIIHYKLETSFLNFFLLFKIPLRVVKCHMTGPQLKLEYAKELINLSLFCCPRTAPIPLISFSRLFVFLQIVDTYFSKFNLFWISIPKHVTDFLDFIVKQHCLWLNSSYNLTYLVCLSKLLGHFWDLQSCCYHWTI